MTDPTAPGIPILLAHKCLESIESALNSCRQKLGSRTSFDCDLWVFVCSSLKVLGLRMDEFDVAWKHVRNVEFVALWVAVLCQTAGSGQLGYMNRVLEKGT